MDKQMKVYLSVYIIPNKIIMILIFLYQIETKCVPVCDYVDNIEALIEYKKTIQAKEEINDGNRIQLHYMEFPDYYPWPKQEMKIE